MSTPKSAPFWAFFARLQTRNDRMMVSWSFGSVPRAQAFRKWMEYGRIEKGSVVFKEKLLPRMAKDLGLPPELQRACRGLAHHYPDDRSRELAMRTLATTWGRELANALQEPEMWPAHLKKLKVDGSEV